MEYSPVIGCGFGALHVSMTPSQERNKNIFLGIFSA